MEVAEKVARRVNARYRQLRMTGNTTRDLYNVILLEEVKAEGFKTPDDISRMRSKVAQAAAALRDARRPRRAS